MRKFYREIDPLGHAVLYAENQPQGFAEVTDPDDLRVLNKKLQNKRTHKGIELFEDIRIDLLLDFNNGIIDNEQVFFIAEKLTNAKSYLITGDWLMTIKALQDTIIEGAYTQARHDEIIDRVTEAYIDLQESY